jgi:hypothetical protein
MNKYIPQYQKKIEKYLNKNILIDLINGSNINMLLNNESPIRKEYNRFLKLCSLPSNIKNRKIFIKIIEKMKKKMISNMLLKKLKGKKKLSKKRKKNMNKSKKKIRGGNLYELPKEDMWFDNNYTGYSKQHNIISYDLPSELICDQKSESSKLIHNSQKIIAEHQSNSAYDKIEDIEPPKDMNKN